jgi:hypothetical protein
LGRVAANLSRVAQALPRNDCDGHHYKDNPKPTDRQAAATGLQARIHYETLVEDPKVFKAPWKAMDESLTARPG